MIQENLPKSSSKSLIIFDLDDTLVDTSGALTPIQLKKSLLRLQHLGLPAFDFTKAYQELLAIDKKAPSSKKALSQFLAKFPYNGDWEQEAHQALNSPLDPDFFLPTTPKAKEILEFFKKSHILALVTAGEPKMQLAKLEKAGIDSSIFSKITIPEDGFKGSAYKALVREFSKSPFEVWVLGDRIENDLLPAKELGLHTIHMRWGRGEKLKKEPWVEYSIRTLEELKGIIP